jgi:beta-1,4-mannosyltransferase
MPALALLFISALVTTPITLFIILPILYLKLRPPTIHKSSHGKRQSRAAVLVLGDIGRSPRMQYHALSLAQNDQKVSLIGYVESRISSDLVDHPNITIHAITTPPKFLTTTSILLFAIFAPLKIIYQLCILLDILLYTLPDDTSVLITQNPPSMPTFIVAIITRHYRGIRWVVDWHNFGYSILALKFGKAPIVGLSEWYERYFGKRANAHLTVTNAMKNFLQTEWNIGGQINVLYDRPPAQFQPFTASARAEFLRKFKETEAEAEGILKGSTKLIVSATSWTPDEDFSILLKALLEYDREATMQSFLGKGGEALPRLLVIVTGKGPLKAYYESQFSTLELQSVDIKTAWLEPEDYPKLLACADLGISLHTSSSGLDLPMKVVDLFGCGVPVLAAGFKCVGELVKDGINGKVFQEEEGLSGLLKHLFSNSTEWEILKNGALEETKERWEENWKKNALPAIVLE